MRLTARMRSLRVPIVTALLVLATFAFHEVLSALMRVRGIRYIGAVRFNTAPLFVELQPVLSPWLVPAVLVLAAYVYYCRSILRQEPERLPARRFVLACIAWFWLLTLGVSLIDGVRLVGDRLMPAFLEPYSRLDYEYFADVAILRRAGLRTFLEQYAQPAVFSELSMRGTTHPPGAAVFLWLIGLTIGPGLLPAAVGTIGFASLSVVPVYLLARRLQDEAGARRTVCLFLVVPSIVLFSATSMDAVFMVWLITCFWLYFTALDTGRWQAALLLGIVLAIAMMFTYSTFVAGLFILIHAAVTAWRDRGAAGTTARLLGIAGAAFCVALVAILGLTGFDFLQAFGLARGEHRVLLQSRHGGLAFRGLAALTNTGAFLIGMGLPLVALWIVYARVVAWDRQRRIALALIIWLVATAGSGLYIGEVDRILMFMAPLAVLPVARVVTAPEALWAVLLLGLQVIGMEALFYTYW